MTIRLKAFIQSFLFSLLIFSAGASADDLGSILKRGELNIGVSLFEPWTMKDDAGQLSGFEIDVGNKLAHDMGVEPAFKVFEWDAIIPALMNGEIDVIAGGMAITPARALKVNFSLPYADSGLHLLANTEKTKGIKSLDELNSPENIISVVSTTASEDLAKTLFHKATIKSVKTPEEAANAILEGTAHVWIAASPQPEFLVIQHPEIVDMPLSKPLLTYKAGLAVKKGNQELLNFLNSWVTSRDADEWLSATHGFWFESLDWR